jgi:dTDP-4-dehydrorhamnose 3,5-epimerase-like enzyme
VRGGRRRGYQRRAPRLARGPGMSRRRPELRRGVLVVEPAVLPRPARLLPRVYTRRSTASRDPPSASSRTTTRARHAARCAGLHAQLRSPRASSCARRGRDLGRAVDIRPSSPDLQALGRRRALGRELPAALGAARLRARLLRLSEAAQVEYKVTAPWDRRDEISIAWDDPEPGDRLAGDGSAAPRTKDRSAPSPRRSRAPAACPRLSGVQDRRSDRRRIAVLARAVREDSPSGIDSREAECESPHVRLRRAPGAAPAAASGDGRQACRRVDEGEQESLPRPSGREAVSTGGRRSACRPRARRRACSPRLLAARGAAVPTPPETAGARGEPAG